MEIFVLIYISIITLVAIISLVGSDSDSEKTLSSFLLIISIIAIVFQIVDLATN